MDSFGEARVLLSLSVRVTEDVMALSAPSLEVIKHG